MAHVFLVGFMGAGKSTAGRLLAESLGTPFVDLDDEIERASGQTVTRMFAESGEPAFRDAESAALERVAAGPDAVVACGGGIVLRERNRGTLAARGTVVLLEVGAQEAMARVGDAGERPLLAGKCVSDVERLLDTRQAMYAAAADVRVTTDCKSPADVAAEILSALGRSGPERIEVSAESARYDVLVGAGAVGRVGELLRPLTAALKAAVVTDETVGGLYGETVESSLREAGFEPCRVSIRPGEGSKDWATAGAVLNELARARLSREDIVVALGGGVVGDLAGFCAASYMRGVSFAQIPTTLLAQVDSSIGGKTGVDLPDGKNLAGAFWQPVLVLADTDVLGSLPEVEWRSGLAEVAKAALLDGDGSTCQLESDAPALVGRERGAVRRAVRMAVALKARVVSEDERESGARESLNYGHTLGHAIERVAGYGVVPHGLAVAEGIRFAALLAERTRNTPPSLRGRQEALLDSLGLAAGERPWEPGALLDAMRADKKARRGAVRFVLLLEPGCYEVTEVRDDALAAVLAEWAGAGAGKGVE